MTGNTKLEHNVFAPYKGFQKCLQNSYFNYHCLEPNPFHE